MTHTLLVLAAPLRFGMLVAALSAVTSMAALVASPVAAICGRLAGDDPVPGDAQYVLVGTVAETDAHGQNALIHVDEIWRGAPLPEWVPLIGTDDRNALWEDSAQFTAGERYLVVADREGGAVRPRGCGYSRLFTAELAALAPPNPSRPFAVARPTAWEPGAIPWPWLGLLAGTAVIAVTLAWRWRWRSRP